MHMQILINTDNNVEGRDELAHLVEATVRTALSRFSDQITRVEAHLGDESAGRPTGDDKRCMLEARVGGRAPVAVTNYADTLEKAFHGAADKLKRLLESEFGRLDDRKGGASIRGTEQR
jgi:ribosome-associated translation inhibitor RaiA